MTSTIAAEESFSYLAYQRQRYTSKDVDGTEESSSWRQSLWHRRLVAVIGCERSMV